MGFENGPPCMNQPFDQWPTPQDASFAATSTKRHAPDENRSTYDDDPKKRRIAHAYEAGWKTHGSSSSANQIQEDANYAAMGGAHSEMGISTFSVPP